MPRVPLGIVLGLACGGIDVLLMLPLSFPNKRAALLGAFCARFALGFLTAVTRLPIPSWLAGIVVGLLTSLPDAIITKAYAPILDHGRHLRGPRGMDRRPMGRRADLVPWSA